MKQCAPGKRLTVKSRNQAINGLFSSGFVLGWLVWAIFGAVLIKPNTSCCSGVGRLMAQRLA